jgi:hypothetical protein
MMAEQFGSPRLNDPTARYDRILGNAQKRADEILKSVQPAIPNRPVGSVKLSKEEEKRDFMGISHDVMALDDRLSQLIAEMGFGPGMVAFADWAKRNK